MYNCLTLQLTLTSRLPAAGVLRIDDISCFPCLVGAVSLKSSCTVLARTVEMNQIFAGHFEDAIVDEIALEGLEGITLEGNPLVNNELTLLLLRIPLSSRSLDSPC